jgi:hypothetical protein
VTATLAPPFRAWIDTDELAAVEGSETVVVDERYIDRMMLEEPTPAPEMSLAEEIAAEPLPEPRIFDGNAGGRVIASAEYMRLVVVLTRRERRRRLGAHHP